LREKRLTYRSVFRPDLFREHTFVVTGGGSGIGRCCAHELASLGAHVAIVGRRIDKLESVLREIATDGGKASAHVCDIRDDAEVVATVDAVLAAQGRIDGLVNNAGGQYYGAMKTFATKGFDAVVRNNLTGGFIFMREVYVRWMEQHGGAIVNMAAAISNGLPGFAHSGAARTGMITLTETAACEWAQSGVRVNCVAPGMIASSGFDNYSDDAAALIRDYAANVPLQRFGNVSEVSSAIVYLLSPAAAFITGACLRIDGGGSKTGGMWKLTSHDKSIPFDGFHRASLPELLKA
jgi:citronellol/citronellal dehydrogenase